MILTCDLSLLLFYLISKKGECRISLFSAAYIIRASVDPLSLEIVTEVCYRWGMILSYSVGTICAWLCVRVSREDECSIGRRTCIM